MAIVRLTKTPLVVALSLAMLALSPPASGVQPPDGVWGVATVRVSVDPAGHVGGLFDESTQPDLSRHGRYVVFRSEAQLVPDDTNSGADVYVRDRLTGISQVASLASNGQFANDESEGPLISADGRYVAFTSFAENLMVGDDNTEADAFIRDLVRGVTLPVSISGGSVGGYDSWAAAISADGRFVVFGTLSNMLANDTNFAVDLYLRDMRLHRTSLVTQGTRGQSGNGDSGLGSVAISADGHLVVFASDASNLAPNDTNGVSDIFVRDVVHGTTTRVSLTADGRQVRRPCEHPSISPDGRYVVFSSEANSLTHGDNNRERDVFMRDLVTGKVTRVAHGFDGQSADGASDWATVSDGGKQVSFTSTADNLVRGDTNDQQDIFVWNRLTGVIGRASVAANNGEIGGLSESPVISDDGLHVAFDSAANDVVRPDANEDDDVFVRDSRGDAKGTPGALN